MDSSRPIQGQRSTVNIGQIFQASLFADTAEECRKRLESRITSSSSEASAARIKAKLYILDELIHKKKYHLMNSIRITSVKFQQNYNLPRNTATMLHNYLLMPLLIAKMDFL
jgi:hypothetical protein